MENKTTRIVVSVIIAVCIATVSFLTGFFAQKCSESRAVSSYDWAMKTIKKYYYFDEPDMDYTETSLKAIADTYLDRYSEYYTKEEYEEVMKSNSGSRSGVGIGYSFVNGRGVYIGTVVGNSPAYKSGLRGGDFLVSGKVAGEEVTFTSSTSFSNFITSVEEGVEITFTSDEGKTYKMAKAEYTASYTYLNTSTERWAVNPEGSAYEYAIDYSMSYLPEGCAYIRLDQFYGTATNEFYKLVEKFNSLNCTSLILDLRSNGGGYVNVMQEIAGCFADGKSTLAMLSRDKKGSEQKFYCRRVAEKERRVDKSVNVFVLANAGTASASEALIGAMYCYGAVSYKNIFLSQYTDEYINWLYPAGKDIKNGQTYGKGIMQTPFTNFKTGEVLKLTTAKIFWPDKKTSIHDRGVTLADGCTPVQTDWEWTKGDRELQSAVEIIKTRI